MTTSYWYGRYGCLRQVQETTLDWLVGLAAATALHAGPAILSLKGKIVQVLKALFTAPSKVNHSSLVLLWYPSTAHHCICGNQQSITQPVKTVSVLASKALLMQR